MGLSIAERIAAIRAALGMSRPDFGATAGLSADTVKTIESRGGTPKGEALEAICRSFPHFAFWLMTGKAQPFFGHLAAGEVEDEPVIEVLASYDIRFPEARPLNERFLGERAIFVQCLTTTDLGCAIAVSGGGYLWAERGHVRLNSERPSPALGDFLEWLRAIGISSPELIFVEDGALSQIQAQRVLWKSDVRKKEGVNAELASTNLQKWWAAL